MYQSQFCVMSTVAFAEWSVPIIGISVFPNARLQNVRETEIGIDTVAWVTLLASCRYCTMLRMYVCFRKLKDWNLIGGCAWSLEMA